MFAVDEKDLVKIGHTQIRLINNIVEGEKQTSSILSINDAFKKAVNSELDLLIINNISNPPIARILNFQKFIFTEKKKDKDNEKKKKQQIQKVKEIKFHLTVAENDYQYKIRHIKEFIEDNCKVKIQIFLRGREIENKSQIEILIQKILTDILNFAKLDGKISYAGNTINFVTIAI